MEQWPAEKGRYSLEFAHRGIYMYMHVQWSAEKGEYCLGFAQRDVYMRVYIWSPHCVIESILLV